MLAHEAGAQEALRAVYARPVTYTGAGLAGATLLAIKSDVSAEPFQGAGETLRQVTFEVRQADLPVDPARGNTLVEADGRDWRVIEPRRRDDIAAWELVVEEAL
jgi:hypothetical protein